MPFDGDAATSRSPCVKIVKAIALTPIWPLIWFARFTEPGETSLLTCGGRANAMLRWYRR
jgi:hypothetical protein